MGLMSEQQDRMDEILDRASSLEPGPREAFLENACAGDAKLRRSDGLPSLELEPTPDILAGIAARDDRPFLVGFAAETGSLEGARHKATTKGVDLLVANDVTKEGSGFATETNEVTFYSPDGAAEQMPLLSKHEVAEILWDRIREARSPG